VKRWKGGKVEGWKGETQPRIYKPASSGCNSGWHTSGVRDPESRPLINHRGTEKREIYQEDSIMVWIIALNPYVPFSFFLPFSI
jgi:hypothetical protein